MGAPGEEVALGAALSLTSIAGSGGVGALLPPLLYFLVVFLGQGAIVLLAYRMPSRRARDVGTATWPRRVSVIVPARNEREDLRRCLDDLARQDLVRGGGSLEVIVVDGASTDGTAKMAEAHPLAPRVVPEPPLPAGWVGKNWACHHGAREARADRLLFLDADVRLAPAALRAALLHQDATGADLVSFAARIVMTGFWERVVMPLYVQFVLLYFLTPRVNVDTSSRAMANGQFMLFRREAYRRIGGHARVAGAVLEDVRLAQNVKQGGGKVRVLWTPELVHTRMYADRREMSEGILKNLHGTRFSASRQVVLAIAIFTYFLSPFLVLGLVGVGLLGGAWLLAAAALVGLTLAKQVGFQRALHAPAAYGLLYPLGCAYYIGLFARSLHRGLGGGTVTWKGRTYQMNESAP